MIITSQFTKSDFSENGNQSQQKLIVTCENDLKPTSMAGMVNNFTFWQDVCKYLNNAERLQKINSMFLTERNSAIWIYSHGGFEHRGNITNWEHLKVTMKQFAVDIINYEKTGINSFPVLKGDRVKLQNGDEGVIIKYPSNKEIHILKDGGEILIIVKDDIKSIVK